MNFTSQLLERIQGLLRGEKASPQQFLNQLRGKSPEGPLGLMFAQARQTHAPLTRESFLASARPPTWKAQKLRPSASGTDEELIRDMVWDNYVDRHPDMYVQAMHEAIDDLTPNAAARYALQALDHLKSNRDIPREFIQQASERSPVETLHFLHSGELEQGDVGFALQPIARLAEQRIERSPEWRQLYQEARETEPEFFGSGDFSHIQRIANLPRYFELGLSSPSHPWTRDPRVIEHFRGKVDHPSEVGPLMQEAQSHFPNYPNLIGHVRGSADPISRTVALEELQADPLQSGVKHPTFRDTYGALAKMAMQLAARRGYEQVYIPTGNIVASVRPPAAQQAMRRIYDRDLGDQLYDPLRNTFGITPESYLATTINPQALERGIWMRYNLEDPEIRRAVATSLPHFATGGAA